LKNINKTKSLIKNECAGYLSDQCSINHYCCNKDGVCLFFEDNTEIPRCKYFEEGVLPLDEDLERQYRIERKMNIVMNIKAKTKVKCERCEESFEANSNRQHYCEKCRKIVKKEQARLSMEKKRNKSA